MTSSAGIPRLRASSTGAALRRLTRAVRAARPTAAAAAVVAVAWCIVWIAAGPVGSPPAAGALVPVPSPGPVTDRLGDEPGQVRRGRCATCGFVVGIREVQPAGFEFTVRLRDGSVRISKSASRGTWHIGDPVMLMGDVAASGQ